MSLQDGVIKASCRSIYCCHFCSGGVSSRVSFWLC